jgi:hypothetical protein
MDNCTIHQQLPQVQKIFAEAFTELQKDIRVESVQLFKSAANLDDPLAMLLDSNPSTQPFGHATSTAARKKKFKATGSASDGGYLRK